MTGQGVSYVPEHLFPLSPVHTLRQRKVPKRKASRIRRPSAYAAGTLRCSGPAGGAETRPTGSTLCASLSAGPCATRLLITAGEPNTQYRTPQGRAMARPCLAVLSVAVGSRLFGSHCRVSGLSSAAAGGSGRALSERSEFSPTPPDASSARYPAGALTSAALLFGDFLLGKQEKVTAPPGAHPGNATPVKKKRERPATIIAP